MSDGLIVVPTSAPRLHAGLILARSAVRGLGGTQAPQTGVSTGLSRRCEPQAQPTRWAERSVFCSSSVMVIGPTPPGTGVIAPATSSASL